MEATAESRAPSLTAEIDDFRNKIGTKLTSSGRMSTDNIPSRIRLDPRLFAYLVGIPAV